MSNTFEARTIFRKLGAGPVTETLAAQHAFYKPITSAPSMASTKTLVTLMQRGLLKSGYPARVSGELDQLTALQLEEAFGPGWKDKTWLEMGKAFVQGTVKPQVSPVPTSGLGAVSFGGQAGMLLVLGGIAFLAWKMKK
jgi:hypothetical protein